MVTSEVLTMNHVLVHKASKNLKEHFTFFSNFSLYGQLPGAGKGTRAKKAANPSTCKNWLLTHYVPI